jgi:hypothetical protein
MLICYRHGALLPLCLLLLQFSSDFSYQDFLLIPLPHPALVKVDSDLYFVTFSDQCQWSSYSAHHSFLLGTLPSAPRTTPPTPGFPSSSLVALAAPWALSLVLFFPTVLGFDLRASHRIGRCSTTEARSPALLTSFMF